MNDITLRITENLNFNMLGIDYAFFEKDLGRPEGLGCLGDHTRVLALQVFCIVTAANTAATAPGCCLNHHRVAYPLRLNKRLFYIGKVAIGTRRHRNTRLRHCAARLGLISHAMNDLRGWPNIGNILFFAQPRKFGVLGKKAIAGMQCIATSLNRQIHYSRWV